MIRKYRLHLYFCFDRLQRYTGNVQQQSRRHSGQKDMSPQQIKKSRFRQVLHKPWRDITAEFWLQLKKRFTAVSERDALPRRNSTPAERHADCHRNKNQHRALEPNTTEPVIPTARSPHHLRTGGARSNSSGIRRSFVGRVLCGLAPPTDRFIRMITFFLQRE